MIATARPGFNYSRYKKLSRAELAKLAKLGVIAGVALDILANPSTAYAAEVQLDWRDSTMQKRYGGCPKQTDVAAFRRVVMVPTPLNVFGDVDVSERTLVVPWEGQGLMPADEAMLLEGMISRKTLYWNLMYTVYEETYYRVRWGGLEYGLPPLPEP